MNPENPDDTERLAKDMPLVKALAEDVIENELGVQSLRTVYREHLYELEGFRALIGPTLVGELRRGMEVGRERLPQLPLLSIRVRNCEPLATFEAMQAEILEARNGGLLIRCASGDGLVLTGLFLNFAEESLEFDPFEALVIRDDGSPNAAMRAVDAVTLRRRLILNGQLEVWNADTGVVLGRCDPVVPVNVDIGATVANLDAQIERISAEAQRRAAV